jgi:hypothetical protein
MTTSLTLTHPSINSGVAVAVKCTTCTVSGKKNNVRNPDANSVTSQVEVQTQSTENLKIVLSGVHFTGTANTLTYAHLLTLYRLRYGGSGAVASEQAATLNVTYGKPGSTTTLTGFDGVTTSIKVLLDDFSFPINMTETKDGYMPIGTITLIETA